MHDNITSMQYVILYVFIRNTYLQINSRTACNISPENMPPIMNVAGSELYGLVNYETLLV